MLQRCAPAHRPRLLFPAPPLSGSHPRAHARPHPPPAPADPLPLFRDAAPGERQDLFLRKLRLCTFTFDFADPAADVREKEMKRQALMDLVDYVNSGSGKFTEAVSRSRRRWFWGT